MRPRGVRILAAALLGVATVGTWVPAHGDDTQTLIVVPAEGHSGGTVYLSGSGFRAGSSLILTMACPDWYSARKNNLVIGKAGPRVGRSGRFTGARFRALKLQDVSTSSCTFYAGGQTKPLAATAPYAIVAANEPLPWCATRICMTVAYRRLGGQDVLLVTGWPGATGTAKVTKGKYRRRLTVAFDWQGIALLTLSHAADLRGKTARVVISAKLDRVTGTYSGLQRLIPGQFARRSGDSGEHSEADQSHGSDEVGCPGEGHANPHSRAPESSQGARPRICSQGPSRCRGGDPCTHDPCC